MRIKQFPFKVAIVLCVSTMPLAVIAKQPTAQPARTTMRASDYGPNASFINGAVLSNAFLALDAVGNAKGAAADNGWLMTISDDGQYFTVAPSLKNPNALTIQVSNGHSAIVPSASMPAAASITLGSLRSIRAAYQYFLTQTGLPVGVDRSLDSYDVLVYPYTAGQHHGRYVGKLYVGFLHHQDPSVKNGFAGCFDGSGYNAGYVVDPGSLTVTARPCT